MRRSMLCLAGAVGLCLVTSVADAGTYDLKTDWSDVANPNGVWTYREGTNALPHVASWQSSVGGGWSTAQPGWAKSENGTDRLPFFFKSNGSETFAKDYVAGDIIVHSTDGTNGVGSGPGNYLWTSPESALATITGGVWMGRDIGRSNHWALAKNGVIFTEGDISSGDAFSRATPFDFATGTGGAAAVTSIPVGVGDQITLTFTQTSGSGDFVGTNLTINTVFPEPGTALLALPAIALFANRRRTRAAR